MNGTRRFQQSVGLVLSLAVFDATAEVLTGRVVGVTDGDTITVLDESNQQYKIRVAGIDAPEKKMPFGQRSKENLSRLVYDKEVAVDWHNGIRASSARSWRQTRTALRQRVRKRSMPGWRRFRFPDLGQRFG